VSWLLFDERGERARKITLVAGNPVVGWALGLPPEQYQHALEVLGFEDERTWRPTWFAAKMSKGYRVFEVDRGVHEFLDARQTSDLWQGAAPHHKRLPTVAAVEMWVRFQAMKEPAS
jgi:hypothetical protein